jgi:hypothetical protein
LGTADPSPNHELPGVVVNALDTMYFSNVTGFGAVAFNGSQLWFVSCPASTYAVTTPVLVDPAGVFVMCSGALGRCVRAACGW